MGGPLSSRPPLPGGPYLVAGLGRAGLAAAEALVRHTGADQVSAWDESAAPEVATRAAHLRGLGVTCVIGTAGEEKARRASCVVKSPGMSAAAPVLVAARAAGAEVIDELELGWRLGRSPMVGVTGTDGKTGTAQLVAAAIDADRGGATVVAGNSEFHPPLSAVEAARGTVVCEASSYQLEGCSALVADVAVLTNLTRDHLHRHGTMEAYAACKRRLFVRDDAVAPQAVVPMWEPFGRALADEIEAGGGTVFRLGAQYRLESALSDRDGCTMGAVTPSGPVRLRLRTPGRHNAMNALAALATADALGLDRLSTIDALSHCVSVPGRFERVAREPFVVVVDFAHTPAAVRAVLLAARELAGKGRVHALISSAGTHDPGKRPAMGRAGAELADTLVLTTGALFGEPAESVLGDLERGAAEAGAGAQARVELDRRAAIASTLLLARPGDVVVVCGRGALPVLRDGADGEGDPFDDRLVVRELLAESYGAVAPGPR